MKLVLSSLIFATLGLSGVANADTLTPDRATESECKSLGMYGDFELRKFEDYKPGDRGRKLFFTESSKSYAVTQSRTKSTLYTSLVRCQFGCSGSMEINLDLGRGEFEYKRNIRFDNGKSVNELCRGVVR